MAYDGTSNFSTDSDLAEWEKSITSLFATGETSFTILHTAARDEILNRLKREHREWFWDYNTASAWDFTIILDETQLKKVSCLYVLSSIFNRDTLSGQDAELYLFKHQKYAQEYNKEWKKLALELDTDGDGIHDETLSFAACRLRRA